MSVHSLTKYLAGHGDVLGGAIVADQDHAQMLRGMGKISARCSVRSNPT